MKLTTAAATRLLVLLSIALLCAGCGFHLRTETLANYVSSVEITDAQSSRITQSLKRHLKQIGISVDSGTSPDVRVRISQHDFEKQASLLAPHGGMIEYELTLTVKLSIGLPVIQSDSDVITLSATQPVKVNAENLLSTSAEEQLVRRELTNTIVGEIIRILSYEMQRAPENKPIQKSED